MKLEENDEGIIERSRLKFVSYDLEFTGLNAQTY
ncbi:MAG: hypothetical protein ACI9W2_003545 [Gammaproteobacteria bacterium]|jgi:hypothetical protein